MPPPSASLPVFGCFPQRRTRAARAMGRSIGSSVPVRRRDAMTGHAPADRLTQTAKGISPTGTPTTLTLAVENMHCGGCLRSVERAALKAPGVHTARASLAAKRVSIVYDPGRAGAGDVIDALQAAGFAAAAIEAGKQNRDDARQNYLLRRVAVAGFAAMNIMLISIAVWSGETSDMDPALASAFRWCRHHRTANGRLCRAAVLPLRARRVEGSAPQHGCAYLARHSAGDRNEPLIRRCRAVSRSISMPPFALCSSCGRSLSRPNVACARPRRGAELSACTSGMATVIEPGGAQSRSRRMRFVPAIACSFQLRRGLAPTAWCWKGRDRSIKA